VLPAVRSPACTVTCTHGPARTAAEKRAKPTVHCAFVLSLWPSVLKPLPRTLPQALIVVLLPLPVRLVDVTVAAVPSVSLERLVVAVVPRLVPGLEVRRRRGCIDVALVGRSWASDDDARGRCEGLVVGVNGGDGEREMGGYEVRSGATGKVPGEEGAADGTAGTEDE